MKVEALERYLNSFGKEIVQGAKSNLQKAKGDTALGTSIRFEVVPTAKGFDTKFYMLDYGTYLDQGVSGNKKQVSYTNYKGKKEISSYSYTTKGPPIDIISKWIKKRGIAPKGLGKARSKGYTSKSGKKVKGTGQYISPFAYLVSRKIKRDGLKSLSFFQEPLGIGYKKLKKQMLKELKLDIETYLTTFYRPK